ncbi:hypothetical protein A5886_001725 [Enterococcus sp. 8G7_MSG3316]|uniref:Pterin-binding domain-containing protein n=2 Tax=Candidatus Enterococcus testudinis TaxID=1834191 RepID=A0A242A6H9_9ENTE|nr:hypothetical protein A5886_001725 [Enterococcus sp. 8G7_MSG3316]
MRIKMVSQLSQLKVPTMIAISRKSFLGKLFEIEVSGRLLSTILLESLMIRNGGRVLRVHDIEETKQMIDIMTCYYETLVGEL